MSAGVSQLFLLFLMCQLWFNITYFQGMMLRWGCHTSHIPLFFSQTCIAKHESNGIDIIIALIVNPINPLGKHRLDLVLELKVSSRCLGPALEGHLL